MEGIYARAISVCSRFVLGGLDPCMPGRGNIRDERVLETPHPLLQPLVFLVLWGGRIPAQHPPYLNSLAEILLPLGEASGKPKAIALGEGLSYSASPEAHPPAPASLALPCLIQGTWKPFSHHPATALSHLPHPTRVPERVYLLSQTSPFTPDIPLLTWMGRYQEQSWPGSAPALAPHPGSPLKFGLTSAASLFSAWCLLKKFSSRKDLGYKQGSAAAHMSSGRVPWGPPGQAVGAGERGQLVQHRNVERAKPAVG